MRERLIELMYEANEKFAECDCTDEEAVEMLADHLLANGVIVLPCKVGDTVYVIDKGTQVWWKGKTIAFYYTNPSDMQFAVAFEDGEVAIYDSDCVFTTREEAEKALKCATDNNVGDKGGAECKN